MARLDGIDLWALDEVRFQQYGSRCRMWIPPEVKDPVLRHFPGRKSVGYFGAVRLRDGLFVAMRETDKFNARSFHAFMKRVWAVGARAEGRMVWSLRTTPNTTMPNSTSRGDRSRRRFSRSISCRPTALS
ncbi:MAG: transposase [Acidobacteria bacterium]|nr:transposase [Acidobacteriota bacterium]